MGAKLCLAGRELREMVECGTNWLAKSAPDIDAINVFPVPDGDTGTNMLLTMRSAVEEAYRAPDGSASAIVNALAHGALMGARGNSGVILSQVFRGLAQGLDGLHDIKGADLAAALRKGSEQAYKGVAKPAEGTMLTVMREAAEAAEAAAANGASLAEVAEAASGAAKDSVARTPTLLPVLREAGVVDAGGQGIFVFLQGVQHYIKGDAEALAESIPELQSVVPIALRAGRLSGDREEPYGYCTEFIIQGKGLSTKRLMAVMNRKGQSVVVVGDESMIRVHVHTLDPGKVLHWAVSKGTLHHIKIENMDEQSQRLSGPDGKAESTGVAVVAVAAGSGMIDVFKSLGVGHVITGGQTMNPSVRDMLRAVESVPSDNVILLPNNKNVLQCAYRVPSLTKKKVKVIATLSISQGIAAMLLHNPELDLEQNASAMESQAKKVRTIEVTKAVRSTNSGGLAVRKGQFIGLLDDTLCATGESMEEVLKSTLGKADAAKCDMVSLYYGSEVGADLANNIKSMLCACYPGVEFELVKGDQPHYHFVCSLE